MRSKSAPATRAPASASLARMQHFSNSGSISPSSCSRVSGTSISIVFPESSLPKSNNETTTCVSVDRSILASSALIRSRESKALRAAFGPEAVDVGSLRELEKRRAQQSSGRCPCRRAGCSLGVREYLADPLGSKPQQYRVSHRPNQRPASAGLRSLDARHSRWRQLWVPEAVVPHQSCQFGRTGSSFALKCPKCSRNCDHGSGHIRTGLPAHILFQGL